MRVRHPKVAANDAGDRTMRDRNQQTKPLSKNKREAPVTAAITISLTTIFAAVMVSLLFWASIVEVAAMLWSLL